MATSSSQAIAPPNLFTRLMVQAGHRTLSILHTAGGLGMLSIELFRSLLTPPFYFRLVVEQVYLIGIKSLLLVVVSGLATGSVMALQFGYGLARFGGTLYVPKVVSLSILREMGPVFTSLLLAGRIGSGIASEVASMKVTQQIDAIRALGTSPVKRIVIPRVMASLIALPLLTLLADYIGLMSAMAVCQSELNISYEFFLVKLFDTLRSYDLTTGLVKAAVFAYFISLVACWKGLNTEGGTQGVGNTTTWVVVVSSVFIMFSDVFLTKLFILTVFPKY